MGWGRVFWTRVHCCFGGSPVGLSGRERSPMFTGCMVWQGEWSFLEAALEGYPHSPSCSAAVGSSPKGVLYFFW